MEWTPRNLKCQLIEAIYADRMSPISRDDIESVVEYVIDKIPSDAWGPNYYWPRYA